MDTPSTSGATATNATQKPKIDPLQLLKCLSILLNLRGGIKGLDDVPRVKGLMAKYSKKLVSKCIYLNILQATDIPFLDAFYEEGGWELVGAWLQEAVSSKNWPLAGQVLTLLDTSPMTVTRLKRTTTPKLVKELSRDCPSEDVQNTAKQLVHKWMEVVRQGDGTAAGVGLGNACAGDDDEERAEGAAAAPFQQEDATLVDLTSPDPEDEDKGETGPSQTPQAGSRESSLGEGGDASSSLDCQDESSNASTESDTTPAPTTPIRITIRSGSQVLAKVSSQRLSQDSTDSDDNKPLSVIKQEVEKARQARKALEAEKALAGAASTTSSTPAAAPTATTTTSLSAPAGDEAGADSTATTSPETNDVQPNGAEGATAEGAVVSGTTPTVHTIVTFTGGLSSTSSPAATQPSAAAEEAEEAGGKDDEAKGVNGEDEGKASDTAKGEGEDEVKDEGKDVKVDNKDMNGASADSSSPASSESKDVVDSKNKSESKEKDKDKEKKSSRDKEKERERKSKESEKDKKKEKEKEKSRSSKSSSNSKSEKEKSSRERHRSSSSSSKDKDKDRRDKDRSKSSSSRDKKSSSRDKEKERERSREKEKEREKERKNKEKQESEVKATLEKVKPHSADGLAKIPRKQASFLDALGSADSELNEAKKPSVKTYKSRGFRNTGLLDEPTKLPGVAGKKPAGAEKKGVVGGLAGGSALSPSGGLKRPSPLDDLASSQPDKRVRSSVSSSPLNADKPGGVKLISPKRPSLSDDGGFMAALTAAGPDSTRKKVTRKRRSSESDPKEGKGEGKEDEEKKEGSEVRSPSSSPVKLEEKAVLSPTSVKPMFNFYQETLKDEDETEEKKETAEAKKNEGEEEEEMETNEKEAKEEEEEEEKKEKTEENGSGDVEMKEENGEETETEMEAEELRDEDIPHAPAVPAPAQEDYEKVEVTFSAPHPVDVPGVLVYHRSANRKKKNVKWKAEEDLKEVFFFELDETERVNVNTIKFHEMMTLEKQREREAMGKNRGLGLGMSPMLMNNMGGGMGDPHMMGGMGMYQSNVQEFMRWSLLPIMPVGQPNVNPGCRSQERHVQAARESTTIAAFYHPAMLPDSPREPDPEMVVRVEPKEVPLHDITGQETICDHRNKPWPEPIMSDPMAFHYGGMGNMGGGGGGGGGGSGGSTSNALAVQLDDKGKVKYDVIARQGHSKDKIVYSKLTDLLPSAITSEDDPELQRPSMEEIEENTEKTRQALEKLTQGKISSAMPVRCAEKQAPAQYIRYTPSQQGVSFNSGATQRVIRMVEQPKDPMEPPKFKINKKVPRGPPSPPAPVMHSPTRKVTVKEQQEWRIPPCVSNWKNAKGYTIPLDKRLAADGRGLQSVHINEKFAKLAEALYIADRKAREQVEMRAQIEKKLQAKEQVRKEENLKELAKKAREENAGLRPAAAGPVDEAEREREKLRQDRSRDRKRESAIANSAADKRGKLTSRERDVTEQIALGLPQKTASGGEAQFDQRLFNQQSGMDSGFGDDESYNVYDRQWRGKSNLGSSLYRPTRTAENEYGADLETLMSTNRFVADRGFSGADASANRTGPVEFQRSGAGDEKEEDDLFGVIGLLTEAKKASKRNADGEDRGRDDRDKRRKRD